MGTQVWHPKWWTKDQHESHWERIKEALRRDWEQTKVDLKGYGTGLDQEIDDTVKQAVGKEPIPPGNEPNLHRPHSVTRPVWQDVEEPIKYGVGVRDQYGAKWDDTLEGTLKTEWESVKHGSRRTWSEVRHFVRHGYDRS
jgi:hypothetical protein